MYIFLLHIKVSPLRLLGDRSRWKVRKTWKQFIIVNQAFTFVHHVSACMTTNLASRVTKSLHRFGTCSDMRQCSVSQSDAHFTHHYYTQQ